MPAAATGTAFAVTVAGHATASSQSTGRHSETSSLASLFGHGQREGDPLGEQRRDNGPLCAACLWPRLVASLQYWV